MEVKKEEMIFKSPLLETDRLILKSGSLEDYIKVYEYDMTKLRDINGEFEFVKQDPGLVKKNVYPKDKNSLFDWIIYLKDTKEPIGNVFAETHNEVDNSNEIGYNLHPNYWGNGYMKEATVAVLDYFFSLGYDKIYCGYSEGNVKSKRAMEKIGFKLDRVNENAWVKDGIPITDYRSVMTKEMYDELYGSKKVR